VLRFEVSRSVITVEREFCAQFRIAGNAWETWETVPLRASSITCSSSDSAAQRYLVYCVLQACRGTWFSINWMKSASRWFYYADILWCTVNKTLGMPMCFYILVNIYKTWLWIPYQESSNFQVPH
jgi:hypothetical protein